MVIEAGKLYEHVSLREYNTFGIDARARALMRCNSESDLLHALETAAGDIYTLGGGSNLLLPDYFDRFVLLNRIAGFEIIDRTGDHALVEIGGGEDWHTTVFRTLKYGLGGIENLSLIPGTTGAAPIQNIGAYGVELTDVFHSLDAIELATGKKRTFTHEDCSFGYRDSIFKRELKGKYIICSVRLKLTTGNHNINTSYGAIAEVLEQWGISEPQILDVSRAVIHIRRAKLPDPRDTGNCGSFFKNPIIHRDQWLELKERVPELRYYSVGVDQYKVPAGWMIDQCGWKGKSIGNVGCYEKQALVLVNKGGATSEEVRKFAKMIQDSVLDKFGILLEPEVNIL